MTDNVWRFGDAEFDEQGEGLSVAGQAVELDRNCEAILGVLLQEAGRDVSKERLLAAGWPDRIVHENSLAKAISRLRQALGPQGDALETVYGYGYTLAVDVERVEPEQDRPVPPSAAAEVVPLAVAGRQLAKPVVLASVGGLLIAAALGIYAIANRAPDPAAQFRQGPPVIGDAPDAIGRLLWVDDHPENNIYEKRFFETHRIAVHAVTSSSDAHRLLAMYDYTAVVSDMGRGEDRLAGLRLVEQMRDEGDDTPVIIYTLRPDGAEAQRAQEQLVAEAGAQGVAVTPQEVRSVVLRAFGNPARRTTD